MRRFFKLWIICSLVHIVAFGISIFFGIQIIDVSREPSATTLAAIEISRVLFFPAIFILKNGIQFPLVPVVVANSLLWGLVIATLLRLGYALVLRFSRKVRQ